MSKSILVFLLSISLLPVCINVNAQMPNYIRVWEPTMPETNPANLTTASTLDKAKMTTQYFDGLGRPIQTVVKQGSMMSGNSPVDLVQIKDYNNRGAEEYKYLQFAANGYAGNSSINDGLYKSTDPFGQLQTFSQTQYPGESYFYSHTKFEISPATRPLESYAPGDNYVGTENSTRHGIKVNYLTNTATDNVKIWSIGTGPAPAAHNFSVSVSYIGGGQQSVTYTWTTTSNMGTVLLQYRTLPSGTWSSSAGSPVSPRSWTIPAGTYEYAIQIWYNDGTPTETVVAGSGTATTYTATGTYGDGQLLKTITEDERAYQTIEFKDKRGNIILKKVQLTAQPDNGLGKDYTGWLCTYYIYDDLEHLRCVIQPKGVDAISTSWTLDLSTQTELCFRYEYDKRGRLVSKQIPGAAVQYFVYDKRDRLVMTQDGNLRTQGKWLVTLYDELNRAVQTGLWTESHDNTYHINQAETTTNYYYPFNSSTTPSSSTWDMLTSIHYDDYDGLPSALSSSFLTTWNNLLQTPSNTTWPYPQMPAQSSISHNKATYGLTKILNSNPVQYISSVSIYDFKDQVIQVQSQNATNALDVVTTQYSWTGQPLLVIQKQQNGVSSGQTHTITNTYSYDQLFRMTSLSKSVTSNINSTIINTPAVTIAQNQYNALGQLIVKKLGQKKDASGNYTSTELTSLNYDYNIRGWLTGINKSYLSSSSVNSNYFGLELNYDKDGYSTIGTKQFNGNIGAMTWRSQGDGQQRKYEYTYDGASRLLNADFVQLEGGTWTNANVNFNVKIGDGISPTAAYDANGNILRMQQWGLLLNTSGQIDDLKYAYFNNGNKLKSVYDDAIISNKLGDFKESSQNRSNNISGLADYGYDKNGNLVSDLNKNFIGSTGLDQTTGGVINYNFLNLVEKVFSKNDNGTDKGNIEYVYDAAGNKIKKVVRENISMSTTQYNYSGVVTTTTAYFGSVVYESKSYNPVHPDQTNYADYSDRLKFILTEEGRIRYELVNPYTCTPTVNRFVFDYFIKDHLGSVRSVLTDQKESICYPGATLEPSSIDKEKQLYDINDSRVQTLTQANIPTSTYSSLFNTKVYETNGSSGVNKKTGLGVTLKVMAGDVVNISAQSYYDKPSSYQDQNGGIPLTELLNSFVGSASITGAKGAITANDVNNVPNNSSYLNSFLNPTPQYNTANAYVNYILFDEQMHFKGGYSDPVQSGSGTGLYKMHVLSPVNVQVNGYIYIFVSNESNYPIYFDNLAVTHTPSPILEETHYYPFGLAMKGISSKAAYAVENKFQYNGKELQNKEFTDGSGLDLEDYGARVYDGQTGRWMNIDPLSDKTYRWSPYTYAFNNPIIFIDPNGMEAVGADGLTNEQWIASSKPGSNPNASNEYRRQNREEEEQERENVEYWNNFIASVFNNSSTGQTQGSNVTSAAQGWQDLDKATLTAYAVGLCPTCTLGQLENFMGRLFENAWNNSALATGFGSDNYQANTDKMSGGSRTTVPDATADGIIQTPWYRPNIVVSKAAWFEVKAKNGDIYNSTSTGQILGHITNLAAQVPFKYRNYGPLKASAASLTLITTSNVSISPGVIATASVYNIIVYQYKAQYMMTGGVMNVRFQLSSKNGVTLGGQTTTPVILR